MKMGLETCKAVVRGAASIACAAWLIGCSPKVIVHVDGYPAPAEVNMAWSGDGSIVAKWFFSRWFMKTIERGGFSEEIAHPEHLLFDAPNNLPPDTDSVVINLQIYNPRMRKYRLVKCVRAGGQAWEEQVGARTIREVQHALVTGPVMAREEIGLSVKIVLEEDGDSGEQILTTGELTYVIEPSERGAPRGR
jgi:hypothetical protein